MQGSAQQLARLVDEMSGGRFKMEVFTGGQIMPPFACFDAASQGYTRRGATMSAVGVRELKNRLTYYLRRARKGEEVIVTERGRPVAVLQSLQHPGRAVSLETRLARLGALGIVTLPTRKGFGRTQPLRISGPPVSRATSSGRWTMPPRRPRCMGSWNTKPRTPWP
jgi:prevent-host-death family protein